MERTRRVRLAVLTAAVVVLSILAYPLIPATQAVDPDDFRERDVDVQDARVVVYFENHLAKTLFDPGKAQQFVNARFTTSIQVEERGLVDYQEFTQVPKDDDAVYALYTNWDVESWENGHDYSGLAVPAYDVFFVSGDAGLKMIDGQYLVFGHEIGHLLEGAKHSPYDGNLMSEPIGGDQLCKCDGDPYAKWAR